VTTILVDDIDTWPADIQNAAADLAATATDECTASDEMDVDSDLVDQLGTMLAQHSLRAVTYANSQSGTTNPDTGGLHQ